MSQDVQQEQTDFQATSLGSEVNINDMASGLAGEGEVDLADFAEEPGGAWNKGWYKAEVIEGYATRSGKEFTTSDDASKNGDSRNLRLCFKVSKPGSNGSKQPDERTLQQSLNYRLADLTPARLAHIKEMRDEFKGVKGAWADRDAQRSSLAIAKLGQLQKAIGMRLKMSGGGINPSVFVGQKLDVYLGIDDNGYNEVRQYAKAGDKGKR